MAWDVEEEGWGGGGLGWVGGSKWVWMSGTSVFFVSLVLSGFAGIIPNCVGIMLVGLEEG